MLSKSVLACLCLVITIVGSLSPSSCPCCHKSKVQVVGPVPVHCAGRANYADTTMALLHASGTTDLTRVTVIGDATVSGMCSATDCTFAGLKASGTTVLHGGSVDRLVASGSTEVRNTKIKTATIAGSANLNKVILERQLTVSGSLIAQELQVPEVSVSTKDCSLQDSTIKTLSVKPRYSSSSEFSLFGFSWKSKSSDVQEAVVRLSGGTKIDRIIFEGGNGLVECSGDATSVGEIVGGRVVKK